MPLFGTTASPFDQDVEKATNEMNTAEDWSVIMNLCDKVNQTTNGPKDCLKSLQKRLQNKIPHVCLQTLVVLDACINNCGKAFRLEVASREFTTEARNFIFNKNAHPKVQQKLKFYIKKWAEMSEFKNDPSLDILVNLYKSLKEEGQDFSDTDAIPTTRQHDPVDAQKEENDIAKAIALSLKETDRSQTAATSATSSLYPSMFGNNNTYYSSPDRSTANTRTDARNVRALYDFEAAEDNELTFKAGEIITVLDDSDPNWWKGYNHRGEGLFPANFVSADLSIEPHEEKKKVQFSEVVDVKTMAAVAQEVVEINEEKIDECLQLIQNADPTGETNPDTAEMLVLEEQCKAMGPLIDAELEKIDSKHASLVGVNSKVMEALQMYHMLMRESYGIAKPVGSAAAMPTLPQQMGMYPGGMPQQVPDPSVVPPQPGAPPQTVNFAPPTQATSQQPPQPASTQFQGTNMNQSAIPTYYQPPPVTYDLQAPNPATIYNVPQMPQTHNMYHQPLM